MAPTSPGHGSGYSASSRARARRESSGARRRQSPGTLWRSGPGWISCRPVRIDRAPGHNQADVAMMHDVDLDVIQLLNAPRREDLFDRTCGEHPAILDHDERA